LRFFQKTPWLNLLTNSLPNAINKMMIKNTNMEKKTIMKKRGGGACKCANFESTFSNVSTTDNSQDFDQNSRN
jgi:hypothetical protein